MTHQGMFLESTQLQLLHAIRRWEANLNQPTLLNETELLQLLEVDLCFKQWLLQPAYPTSTPGSLLPICQSLHERLLSTPALVAEGIADAMHQAIQNRLLRQNFATEVAKSQRDMLYNLAYGLSHEINNPLANISTRAQLLLPQARNEKEKQLLGNIVDQCQRAFEMLGDFMQCAKTPTISWEWLDPVQLLQTTVETFVQAGTSHVEWKVHTPSDAPFIYSDRDLVISILDILIQNSLEALGAHGTIVARLGLSKSHCEFSIQDTGHGLSVESRQHAMDPFYSGRDAGRGIGLGLCKANHFAKALRAELTLTSQAGAGCLAKLSIPLSRNQRPS